MKWEAAGAPPTRWPAIAPPCRSFYFIFFWKFLYKKFRLPLLFHILKLIFKKKSPKGLDLQTKVRIFFYFYLFSLLFRVRFCWLSAFLLKLKSFLFFLPMRFWTATVVCVLVQKKNYCWWNSRGFRQWWRKPVWFCVVMMFGSICDVWICGYVAGNISLFMMFIFFGSFLCIWFCKKRKFVV